MNIISIVQAGDAGPPPFPTLYSTSAEELTEELLIRLARCFDPAFVYIPHAEPEDQEVWLTSSTEGCFFLGEDGDEYAIYLHTDLQEMD